MNRIKIVYNGIKLGVPHVFVKDEPLKTIDVLIKSGLSRSEASRLLKQKSIKIEDCFGEKHQCGEMIDDSNFSVIENGKISGLLMWIGKKNPLLVVCN